MTNSDKKQSGGLISGAFGVVKKISGTGLKVINHVAPRSISKLNQNQPGGQIVDGFAKEKSAFDPRKYDNPQQMLREHMPNVTGKLLGKHYKKINQVASFISPDLNDRLSDYLFDQLNGFVSGLTSVDAVLKEVGAKSLTELAKDPERSLRISRTLANQNKIIAAIQGTLTGALGGVGAIVDVPSSLAIALRSIYHTGRAHGFELKHEDQAVVEYIFKQIDLGNVAEKQALMAAIRTLSGILETHNVNQLQQLLGSGNDIEVLKRLISNDDGSFKLNWLNNIPKFGVLNRLAPLATMGISAVYNWKLVDDATDQAEIIFVAAQHYKLQHPDEQIDPLTAYEKYIQLITEASPILLQETSLVSEAEKGTTASSQVTNDGITDIKVQQKSASTEQVDVDVAQGIQQLADTHVLDAGVSQDQAESAVNVEQSNEEAVLAPKARRTTRRKTTEQSTETVTENAEPVKSVTKKRTRSKTAVQHENTGDDGLNDTNVIDSKEENK